MKGRISNPPLGRFAAVVGPLLAAVALLASGCKGSNPDSQGSLSVSPETAVVQVGGAPVAFTSSLQGATETVHWTLSGPGSIAPAEGSSTTYTPPNDGTGGAATLTAAAGSLSATAAITIQPAPALSISPSAVVTTLGGNAVTLNANLVGSGETVSWTLTGPGTLSGATGATTTYQPPASGGAGSATVTATAGALTANAPVLVNLPPTRIAQVVAFAWAHSSTSASYTPSPTYSYNASGGAITAYRSAPGDYAVTFSGLNLNSGDVQVTGYGSSQRCNLDYWDGDTVYVKCFDASGAPADSRYSVSVTLNKVFSTANTVAYAWAHDPAAASYAPSGAYAFNASGGAITATRSAVGTYALAFEGLTLNSGNVQVTAYNSDRYCNVKSWSGGAVYVLCFDSTGAAADSKYVVTVVDNNIFSRANTVAYAWADDSTSDSYSPDSTYAYNSTGQPVVATRSGTGTYSLQFIGQDLSSGNVKVSGYNSNSICNVAYWSGDTVHVQCRDGAGVPVDSRYAASVVLVNAPSATSVVAYAYADSSTSSSYTPLAAYSYNASNGAISATRSAAGTYSITFAGLDLSSGNVQVSAYATANRCNVSSWFGSTVYVKCYNPSGALADSWYTVTVYLDSVFSRANTVAYAWASDPSTASYGANPLYSYNSAEGAITASRSATGQYIVDFGGVTVDGGVPQVSAYGSDKYCVLGGWTGSKVYVNCYDHTGAPADALYAMNLVKKDTFSAASTTSYAWTNDSAAASYTPDSLYSYSASGQAITATRSDVGNYALSFSGLQLYNGNVKVSAYSSNATCNVAVWGANSAWVRCYDSAGAPVDSRYTLAFTQ